MKRLSFVVVLLSALLALPSFAVTRPLEPAPERVPKVQIAILLDTSSSMDGLINQTREQLWRIVNTFATAKRDGKKARLELALYQYGNDALHTKNWIQQVVPLTSDLDKVSEALFKLRTNGGEEYCGAVIEQATKELEWSGETSDLKLIYIAGNEPFTQGPVDYRVSVKAAISKGIVVNTIHAGDERAGIEGHWKDGALLADGSYVFIDQNKQVARVDAPQDKELAELNAKLNTTYIAYGDEGGVALARQAAQDTNAKGMSGSSMATRVAAKASAHYDNSGWDMVDAKKAGKKIAEMPAATLPAPMQKMSKEEREKYVETKEKERTELQAKIGKLAADRDSFVKDELKKRATASKDKTLDDALIESARTQATKKAWQLE